jgi:hypothetical protein
MAKMYRVHTVKEAPEMKEGSAHCEEKGPVWRGARRGLSVIFSRRGSSLARSLYPR